MANERDLALIEEFRASKGELAGRPAGSLLLLTTTGARSGSVHTTPLACHADNGRLIVIASKGGAPVSPGWYHNLVANPEVTVEAGAETYRARAVVTSGDERDRLYAHHAALYPIFSDYETRTTRKIPVVALERIS